MNVPVMLITTATISGSFIFTLAASRCSQQPDKHHLCAYFQRTAGLIIQMGILGILALIANSA